jgi:hypothetical protein
MSQGKITRASLAVEIDGKPYFVLIPQDRTYMLAHLASALCEGGTLTVTPAPEGFKFASLSEMKAAA